MQIQFTLDKFYKRITVLTFIKKRRAMIIQFPPTTQIIIS